MKLRAFVLHGFIFTILFVVSSVNVQTNVESHSNEFTAQNQLSSQVTFQCQNPFFIAININGSIYMFSLANQVLNKQKIGAGNIAAVGDFDNDGYCEILAIRNSDRILRLYDTSNGEDYSWIDVSNDAYPNEGFTITIPPFPDSTVADFDKNGFLDFAFTGRRCTDESCLPGGEDLIQLHLNMGNNTFDRRSIDVIGVLNRNREGLLGLDSGDFNKDGFHDLAAQHYWNAPGDNITHVLMGNGYGAFSDTHAFTNPNPGSGSQGGTKSLISGDFNNDGNLDLVVGQDDDGDAGQTWLYVGNGNGNFTYFGEAYDTNRNVETGTDGNGAGLADTCDFDSDGNLDVIAAAKSVGILLFLSNNDGTFKDQILIDGGENWLSIATPRTIQAICSMTLFPISGMVTDGYGHNLSGVFVELLTDVGNEVIASTNTLDNGYYQFANIPTAENYVIRVTLQDENGNKRIIWGESGQPVIAETQPFTLNESIPFTFQNIDFNDTTLNYFELPEENASDLAAMYYHASQVDLFIMGELSETGYESVEAIWGFAPKNRCSGKICYTPSDEIVNIEDDASSYFVKHNNCTRPMNREWHESFHHLMAQTIGLPDLNGENSHGGFDNSTTTGSWIEGWADFFPAVLKDVLGVNPPYLYTTSCSLSAISLERNYKTWDYVRNDVSREEFAVASLLWDLYDPKDPADSDFVDLDLETLWDFIGQQSINELETMRDVYEVLIWAIDPEKWCEPELEEICYVLTNEDDTNITKPNLDQIFIEHGFFADGMVNDNNIWEMGEDPGWGGKLNENNEERRSTPLAENAYIKVNVENENGIPVEGAYLVVDVVFKNSYYNYSFTVDLPNSSSNFVYLEPPPSTDYVTINISAFHNGGRSTILSLDNVSYWEEVIDSTAGYAVEHTFVIDYETYLPLISNE